MDAGPAAIQVIAQVSPSGFWGAYAPGNSVDDLGQDVGCLEAELVGCPRDLVGGVGRQAAGDLGQFRGGDRAEQVVDRLEFPVPGDLAELPDAAWWQ
jgi:hypothetical protein